MGRTYRGDERYEDYKADSSDQEWMLEKEACTAKVTLTSKKMVGGTANEAKEARSWSLRPRASRDNEQATKATVMIKPEKEEPEEAPASSRFLRPRVSWDRDW